MQYTFCDLNLQSASMDRDSQHKLVLLSALSITETQNEERWSKVLGAAIHNRKTYTFGGGGGTSRTSQRRDTGDSTSIHPITFTTLATRLPVALNMAQVNYWLKFDIWKLAQHLKSNSPSKWKRSSRSNVKSIHL